MDWEWLNPILICPALLTSHAEGLSFWGGLEGSGEGELWLLYKMNRKFKKEKVG